MIDRRALLGTLGLGIAAAAHAQTAPPARRPGLPGPVPGLPEPRETIDLWPNDAPGLPSRPPVETVNERSTDPTLTDRAVLGITRPRLVVFRPRLPNGSAVLVTPGGGYRWVVVDKEGYEVGRWLAARGWTVFVLFYRLPGEGWSNRANVPLQDAQRAMRLIRARARDYGIYPERVAAMGFSAGGHLCADLATRHAERIYTSVDAADGLSARPDLAAPIYPVQSLALPHAHRGSRDLLLGHDPSPELVRAHSPENNVSRDTPPCFLVHAEDDETVPVENSLLLRAALKRARVHVETHLFTHGGHGFGLRRAADKPAEAWPELFVKWAASYGL